MDKAIRERAQKNNGSKIRKDMIRDATFGPAEPGHASGDTPWEEKVKRRRNKESTWTKKR